MKKLLVLLASAILPAIQLNAAVYSIDDGSGETGLGGFGSTNLWLNQFVSIAGMERITTIQVNFGDATNSDQNGQIATAYIYSDPNNDGNPDDAILVGMSTPYVIQSSNTDTYEDIMLTSPVDILGGNNFFVGVSKFNSGSNFGPARDSTTSAGVSWDIRWFGSPDFSDLSTAGTLRNYDDVFSPGGNATIRAVGIAIPEPASAIVLGLGGFLFVRRRRHRP